MDAEALHARLLGSMDLRLGEQPLPPLDSAQAESRLAYLARCTGRPAIAMAVKADEDGRPPR